MLGSGLNLLICTSGQIKMSCGAYLFSGILPSTITFPCLYISQPPNFFVLCSWLTGPQGWTDSHSQCGYQDWLWYWGWQAGSDVQRVYSAKCKLSGTWWWCFYPAGCVWDPPFDQLLLVRPITEDGCALYTVPPVGVKFQSDLIVYNECLFMSRNTDFNCIKCFKEGSVVLNLSQSCSLELSVTCCVFSLGGLLPRV